VQDDRLVVEVEPQSDRVVLDIQVRR
jgi:hypothetical protein